MYIGTLPLVGQLPPTRSNSWGKQVVVEKRLVICQEGFSDCQLSPTQCMTINDKVKELVDAMNLLQVRVNFEPSSFQTCLVIY